MLALSLLEGVSGLVKSGLDFFQGDDKLKAEVYLKELDATIKQNIAQAEVNKNEALNANVFVSGWRPAMGWVCVASSIFSFVVDPFIFPFFHGSFPELSHISAPTDIMFEMVLGMLGLSGLRTYEKKKGVTK